MLDEMLSQAPIPKTPNPGGLGSQGYRYGLGVVLRVVNMGMLRGVGWCGEA